MQIEVTKKRFTVDDYCKMDEAGILTMDNRTELVDGEIIVVSGMGPRHAVVISRVTYVLLPLFLGNSLLVYRDSSNRTYKTALSFKRGESISCLAFPDIPIPVQELLA